MYWHEVLDVWFEQTVKPRRQGRAFLIRYADDAVLVFEKEHDARRVMEVLPKRFTKYGLTLHSEKTRRVPFQRPPRKGSRDDRKVPQGTFDLLGFTHYWGLSRNGNWVVKRKTAAHRRSRALKSVAQWCRTHRHRPMIEQWETLSSKLRGHYAYYGITGNSHRLGLFHHWTTRIWRKWLDRRSDQARVGWDRFNTWLGRFPLPTPVVVHSVLRRKPFDPRRLRSETIP